MTPSAPDTMMMQHRAAHLREVIKAGKWITDSLSTAGFEDVHEDEVPIVLAMARGMDPKMIQERALGRIADRLVSNGYVEFRAISDAPGRKMLVLTERGLQAHEIIGKALGIKRWADFSFRQGDVVISALPKTGTTWMQMICALLVFQTPVLPAPLQELSPWMDDGLTTSDEVYSRLAGQGHRRFIKSHLLPGEIPVDARATYIVLGRHPLDSAVSVYYVRSSKLSMASARPSGQPESAMPSPHEALLNFINGDSALGAGMEGITLPLVLPRLSRAWEHRDAPNVVFVHYEDLLRDLEGQMRSIAGHLDITVPEVTWPGLVRAATFEQMRAVADRVQPVRSLKDQPQLFFRSGRSGAGRELLTGTDLDHYHEQAARLAPPDLLAWLQR
jgi:aryl sulfotransferase